MLHQIPRRDDKVEEISMQILTGKQMLKGRIELFKEIYSAVSGRGKRQWGLARQFSSWQEMGFVVLEPISYSG